MPRTQLEKLKSERRQLRRGFTKTYNEISDIFAKSAQTEEEISVLKSTAEALHEQFRDCQILDKELRGIVLEEIQNEEESDAFFDEVTEVTNANRGKINKLLFYIAEFEKKNIKPTPVSNIPTLSNTSTLRSKLPDLQLPTFDGQITEWNGFWERFQSQVGTLKDLPKSSKFTYLIGQLRGEALKTVQGIIPSEQNYSVLEETLKENFGQPRRIIRAHVCNILRLPKPTQAPSSLRQFYNSLMGDIRSLEALGINVSACAPFIIPIIEDKLPGKVRSALGDSGQGVQFTLKPFTDSLKAFISREEQSLIGISQIPQQPPSRYDTYEPHVTTTLTTTVQTRCQLCHGNHASSICTMPASEKSAAVISLKLCLNCLRPGHRVSNCNAKGRCAKCKGKHHTSIHGIRIHSNVSNPIPQRNITTSTQPPSRTQTNANTTKHAISTAVSVTETGLPTDSTSHLITTNCAPVLDNNAITIQSHTPFPITIKSPPEALNVARANDFVESLTTTSSSNDLQNSLKASNHVILLKTAKAVAVVNDQKLTANIFFDEGSQRSYVRAEFAEKLGLKPVSYERLSVSSFGGAVTTHNYCVSTIGLETPSGIESIKVLVSDEIVQPLNQSGCLRLKSDPRFQGLKFANDFSDEKLEVDILIGADAAYRFLGPIDERFNEPFIQTSKFGSIVSGPLPTAIPPLNHNADSQEIHSLHTSAAQYDNGFDANSQEPSTSSFSIENLIDNAALSLQVDRLIQNQYVNYDVDQQKANHFIQSYQKQVEFRDGHYFAPLPWKADHPPLQSNLEICKRRLTQVTSRLHKLGLMDQYCQVMKEHLAKGYIEELSDVKQPWPEQGCHYLPHFFVLKDSETTPLRIVFAANSGQVSLNDCLYTGPCLLNNLVELLLRFRFPQYAFVADIQRAFLHIKLREEDRPFVRFLWYKDNDPTKEICVYTYTTIVFGHTSSPMSLGAVLSHHLEKFSSPVAVDISDKLYVDNLLSGVENESEAVSYFHEARDLMLKGNFVLRQWCTNSNLLKTEIHKHSTGTQSSKISILGLSWDTQTDTISFPAQNFNSTNTKLTKRKVLSMASKLYDPLGMLSPVTLVARLFLAELWEKKFGWDQPLPPSLTVQWHSIEKELNAASQLAFSRWVPFDKALPVSLHVFTDASKFALGVTAYLTQATHSFLIGSKSKIVSHSKGHLTIPQLELSAMFLGSQYCDTLLNVIKKDFNHVSVYLWTDSEIALFWLASKRKLKHFVQNKVDAINRTFDSSFWGHTPSQDNPADIVSRGCSASSLSSSTLWQYGPSWLCSPSSWPQWPKSHISSTAALSTATDQVLSTSDSSICNVIDINRFNSYSRLLAVSVYVYRFCYRTGITGLPTTLEIEAVERAWLKSEQLIRYPDIVSHFATNIVPHKSRVPPLVRQLNLFLGDDGIIRSKGRFMLESALILLPRNSRLTDLIIRDCHHRQHHVGVGGTIVALRSRFWVPSARTETRRLLAKCVTCRKVTGRHYALPTSPELPSFRYDTSTRPFSNVGIDFAGPLTVKDRSGTHVKTYICLFTCLTTRAINLEVVEDLSTSSFLQALRRHCSLFSTPRLILSDNAQTFKRAEKDLQTLLAHLDSPAIQNAFTYKRIRFLYIPARSPHWGGVYERMIGLMKSTLKKVLGRSLVLLAELSTLIKEIQAVLNDRPLTVINPDVNELQPLTPNHLIFGFNITSLPHPSLDSDDYDPNFGDRHAISRAQHYRTTLYRHFVQRFHNEYLSFLREAHALHNNTRPLSKPLIKDGEIVLVADTDTPRHRWALGVVTKLLRGSDGFCRAAVVRTAHGHTTRSIIKLFPLELAISNEGGKETVEDVNELCKDSTRPTRKAARDARDIIHAQLIDFQQD